VCVVSAHWVTSGSHVLTSAQPQTIHDFYGFPRELYEVQYPAPGAPVEAGKVASNPEIVPDEKWGLDHGSWSVLRHMYPNADVPAFQLSLDEQRGFKEHLELGREIRSLRERGVLILGSGNIVHNLRRIAWNEPHGAYDWAVEFDAKVKAAVDAHDASALARRRSGERRCWRRRIRRWSIICRCSIAWGAPTSTIRFRIRMKGLISGASRCGRFCSAHGS
jgi:4,5-DOPA dioxygenase extradiol